MESVASFIEILGGGSPISSPKAERKLVISSSSSFLPGKPSSFSAPSWFFPEQGKTGNVYKFCAFKNISFLFPFLGASGKRRCMFLPPQSWQESVTTLGSWLPGARRHEAHCLALHCCCLSRYVIWLEMGTLPPRITSGRQRKLVLSLSSSVLDSLSLSLSFSQEWIKPFSLKESLPLLLSSLCVYV